MTDSLAPPRRRLRSRAAANHDLNDAATDLVLTFGGVIFRDARRYSACSADAEDAYQRAIETLLTKAPTADREQLLPWIRRVARNEAIEIARQRKRLVPTEFESEPDDWMSTDPTPEERAEDSFSIGVAAEALSRLTKDQARCLRIQADGHSYKEIAQITGFSARKVTRCVIEGRRAFVQQTSAIEAGSECARIEPLLHLIADGEESARESAGSHLANCGACRATLRAYVGVPSNMAALFPVAVLSVNDPTLPLSTLESVWHSVAGRVASQAYSVQQWAEIGTAKKLGAVVAVTAAVATGTTVVDKPAGGGSFDERRTGGGQSTEPTSVNEPAIDTPSPPLDREASAPDEVNESRPDASASPRDAGDLLSPQDADPSAVVRSETSPPPRSTLKTEPGADADVGDLAP